MKAKTAKSTKKVNIESNKKIAINKKVKIKTAKDAVVWNLDEICPLKEFDSALASIEKRIARFPEFFKKLDPAMSLKDFVELMEFDEELSKDFSKLSARTQLMEAADQKSETAKFLTNKVKDLSIKYSDASRSIWHWMKGKEVEGKKVLDDSNASRLFKAIPDLEYSMAYSRQAAKYVLKESEEKIITKKDLYGQDVLTDLRTLLVTEFKFYLGKKGAKAKKALTEEELNSLRYSKNLKDREAAYRILFAKYKENLDKLFMIYEAVVKDWVIEAQMRGYKSSISVRNFGNHIPDEAIETLLKVCTDNKAVFHRYFKFKAKELGLKKLRRFDIYAPLNLKDEGQVDYTAAKNEVLEVLYNFSKGFGDKAKEIIDANHVDSHPSPVKQGGAFCYTVSPDLAPYVLLNYTGSKRDMSTIAHELGHGIHSLYARNHYHSVQHANLPLAETASTFSEMIMFERLLSEAKNDSQRKAMLSNKMGEFYATILRQNYFVKFEIEAHQKIKEGVTAEQLSQIWLDGLKDQFGDSVIVDDVFRYEWATVPHIVNSPFYCYAYNFGLLLSFALFARYKKEGKSFIPKIERILAAGGSQDPQKVLQEVGIDMTSKEFWQSSFEIIKDWQDKLEKY